MCTRRWGCILRRLGGCTPQPVVEVGEHPHALYLYWHQSCCHTLGEDPWGQGETEGEHSQLVVVALEGEQQEGQMMSCNWDMERGVVEVHGCKPSFWLDRVLVPATCASCGKVDGARSRWDGLFPAHGTVLKAS